MNIETMIKEILALRDEAICTDEHCNCNRFDDIIYALKEMVE
tara:strand:- start:568 stop:693 length:126 start_codon:yes stop_codon:yes gene_type:complete